MRSFKRKTGRKFLVGIASVMLAVAAPAAMVSADPVVIFDSDSKSLQLDDAVATLDYAGAPAVLFEFTYTNKTSEAKTPMTEYFLTVFQDGVSLSSTVISDANYSGLCANSLTQVKDGASVSYALPYKLNNAASALDVEITDAIYGGEKQSFSIPLSGEPDTESESEGELINWEEKYKELEAKYNDLLAKYEALSGDVTGMTAAESEADIQE